jgi:hypothetical protein
LSGLIRWTSALAIWRHPRIVFVALTHPARLFFAPPIDCDAGQAIAFLRVKRLVSPRLGVLFGYGVTILDTRVETIAALIWL